MRSSLAYCIIHETLSQGQEMLMITNDICVMAGRRLSFTIMFVVRSGRKKIVLKIERTGTPKPFSFQRRRTFFGNDSIDFAG